MARDSSPGTAKLTSKLANVGQSKLNQARDEFQRPCERKLSRMITVTGPLWLWTGESGSWHFITVPEELSEEVRAHALGSPRGFRSVKVEARIGDTSWRTSIFPMKSGGYFLPVKKEVRCRAAIGVGDEVTVELELL